MNRYFIITLFLFFTASLFAQEYQRNIMIEVFTNSHCPLCPGAHNTIDSYLANSPNSSRVKFMYYHMSYPYPDDQLYQDNTADPDGRNQVYGPFSSTPRAFFDGELQSNSYNNWESRIDNRLAVMSPVDISLSGNVNGFDVNINAELDMNSSLSDNLVIHFVVVEDVEYSGRNGINNHKNVVRNMITSPTGESISVSANQTISKSFTLSNFEKTQGVSFIVFVQNSSTLEIYQAEEVTYADLSSTDVNNEDDLSYEFSLEQNYPNPFNPTTQITFTIPSNVKRETQDVSLIVYDILGREIKTLINKNLSAGNYEVTFDASDLPSGVYVYSLLSGRFQQSKKMLLIK